MAFIFFFFFLKFEKVKKTGIMSKKFSLRCTPSVILGYQLCTIINCKTNLVFDILLDKQQSDQVFLRIFQIPTNKASSK